MALINKIITGYIIQVFDTDLQQIVSQEFTPAPSEAIEYEMAEDGETLTDDLFTAALTRYEPIVLVSPDKVKEYHERFPDATI